MYSIVIQYFCRLYSIIDYYKILNIVPSSILCILVAYQDLYANSSHQFVCSSFLHPLVIKNFTISMSFYIYIHLYYFLGYIYVLSCSICLSFSYLFYLLYSWSVHGASNSSVIFCFWVIFHCVYTMYVCVYIYIYIYIYISHYLNSLTCWWGLGLLPCLFFCKYWCYETREHVSFLDIYWGWDCRIIW